MISRYVRLAAIAGIVLATLTGCANFKADVAKLATPTYAPFIQVAVDAAVAGVVGKDAATQKEKAAKIKTIAQAVLAADTGTSTALVAIEAVVNAKVAALKLPPADLAAAQILTATLTGIIQSQLTSSTAVGAVTAETQVAISLVLNDVITATSIYGV